MERHFKLLLNSIHSDASMEEVDRYLSMLWDVLYKLRIGVTGFVQDEKGVYLIAQDFVLDAVKNLGTVTDDDFDFAEYIRDMEKNYFWLIDYENVKGPTLVRYQR